MNVHGTTRVYGIIGDPVAHSLSPTMHNAAFQALGIDALYLPFHVVPGELENAIKGVRALEIAGLSVTVPHKERIIPFLDDIDATARRIGAVNTVVNAQGRLIGYNTDGPGFIRALRDTLDFSPKDREIVLIGAGGAARAALVALAAGGAAAITVANRSLSRALALIDDYQGEFPHCRFQGKTLAAEELTGALSRADLFVNTSTLGLQGESFPLPLLAPLRPFALIFDMVYAREKMTPLVLQGEKAGHRAVDGRGMLIAQGEEAFLLWTGKTPTSGIMKQALSF